MAIDYAGARYAPRGELFEAHDDAWRQIGQPGTWWNGSERRAMVQEARHALSCALCRRRVDARSPNAVAGEQDACTTPPRAAIDVIHRIIADLGRLSRTRFEDIRAQGC